MYKTVIFDLDGTLLDTIQDLADAANYVCEQRGWPVHTVDEYKKMVGNGIPKLVERFSPVSARHPEQLNATLEAFLLRYSAFMRQKTAPYAGIPEMLTRLKNAGVQMAVLSNKQDSLSREVVGYYFDSSLFCKVRGALPGVPTKPDPAGVHRLMDELSADAASTLFVGDSDVDILTAKNSGLAGCGVLWGFRDRSELEGAGADHIAATPEELEAVILGL